MAAPYGFDQDGSAVLLAHGGSHTKRDQPPKQTPIVAPPASQQHKNSPQVQSVTPPTEPIQGATNGQHLMESVLGLPFGLGELSLAAILVVPLSLMALKRILQS